MSQQYHTQCNAPAMASRSVSFESLLMVATRPVEPTHRQNCRRGRVARSLAEGCAAGLCPEGFCQSCRCAAQLRCQTCVYGTRAATPGDCQALNVVPRCAEDC